ncbi:MAG: hypothetical protein B7X58_16295, partial [Marinobacter sp. 34-60-7]
MESSPVISAGLPIALFIIMTGIGMTLTLRDFRQVAVYPRGLIVGTVALRYVDNHGKVTEAYPANPNGSP